MVLFEYEYRDTFFHKMNPVTKFVIVICVSLLTTVYWDGRFLFPLTALSFLIAWRAKVPGSWIKLLMVFYFLSMYIRFTQSLMLVDPALFFVLEPELINTTVFQLTPENFPIFGKMAFTYGSIWYLVALLLKGPVTWTIGLSLIYSTPLNDILQALKSIRLPDKLLFVVMVAWRFLPIMIRNIGNVVKAQTLRGWFVKTRNPGKLTKQIVPITAPLARMFVQTIDTIAISVELRAFGAGKITSIKRLKFSKKDILLIVILPVLTVFLWYLALVYYIGLM